MVRLSVDDQEKFGRISMCLLSSRQELLSRSELDYFDRFAGTQDRVLLNRAFAVPA